MSTIEPVAVVAGEVFTGLADVTGDPEALDSDGPWVVVAPFAGEPVCARFTRRTPGSIFDVATAAQWPGLPPGTEWSSSLAREAFMAAVETVRAAISRGELTQVNLTRCCSAPLPGRTGIAALAAALAVGNPAPAEALVSIRSADVEVASASPESFLRVDGHRISSSPIKGTTVPGGTFPEKDFVENRLVAELVATELSAVCVPGSVHLSADCTRESHPGLDHLVSTVEGTLGADVGWADIFAALVPPASVTGAPRDVALDLIEVLEPGSRGPYCGTIGLVDAEARRARLNVAIRTFWFSQGRIHLGTGAGITAGSDPEAEWDETELKTARLLAVASAPAGRITP